MISKSFGRDAAPPEIVFENLPRPMIEPEPVGRVLCPRAVRCDDGHYRLYFMEHGSLCPANVAGVIVSAISDDGLRWRREPGIRLGPAGPRSSRRVLAPDVVELESGGLRMYAEGRSRTQPSVIISAKSEDGLAWVPEPGLRLADPDEKVSYGSPCCVGLPGGGWRIYFHSRSPAGAEIISARSKDGLSWQLEPGVRIARTKPEEDMAAYGAFVGRSDRTWWMLYAGWAASPTPRGRLLAAVSEDGLNWKKLEHAVLGPGDGPEVRSCSEPSLFQLDDGSWRLYYEACDRNGTWRILGASAPGA